MNIGFYLVESLTDPWGYRFAASMIASVRRTMPSVSVEQLTDWRSPAASGVDRVHRLAPQPLALLRTAHQARLSGEWLFVDTDVQFQSDVRHVFDDRTFDVALADRRWPHLQPVDPDFAHKMPWNIGVVFSRCEHVWRDVHAMLVASPTHAQDWMGDQIIAGQVLRNGRYRVEELPGWIFNFPPAVSGDDLVLSARLQPHAAIVHYKGPQRKQLLQDVVGSCVSA